MSLRALRRFCSCGAPRPPPCPPCAPAPRPACRAAPLPAGSLAEHRVCCVPAPRHRPPCPPTPPLCSKTCDDVKDHHTKSGTTLEQKTQGKWSKSSKTSSKSCINQCVLTEEDCGAKQDLVARRLAAAANIRRELYENSVQCREKSSPPPLPPYTLPGPPPLQPQLRCASDCTPPAPQLVQQPARAQGPCQPRAPAALDPCAHRPRAVYHIQRAERKSETTIASATEQKTVSQSDTGASAASKYRGIGDRIKQALSGASCQRRPCGEDKPSCTAKVPPASAPPCRPRDALRDQLKLRKDDKNKRCFHTSAIGFAPEPKDDIKKTVSERIKNEGQAKKSFSNERDNLKEVARGRDRLPSHGGAGGGGAVRVDKDGNPLGSSDTVFEIPVPPNARNIRVQVSVAGSFTYDPHAKKNISKGAADTWINKLYKHARCPNSTNGPPPCPLRSSPPPASATSPPPPASVASPAAPPQGPDRCRTSCPSAYKVCNQQSTEKKK